MGFSPVVGKANKGENPNFDLCSVVLDSWMISPLSSLLSYSTLFAGFWFLPRVAKQERREFDLMGGLSGSKEIQASALLLLRKD